MTLENATLANISFSDTKIKIKHGTAAEWTAANPILAAGEPGYETDTGILKIGDGTTAYNSLSKIPAVPVEAVTVELESIPLNPTLKFTGSETARISTDSHFVVSSAGGAYVQINASNGAEGTNNFEIHDKDDTAIFTFHDFGIFQMGVDSATPISQQIKSADQIDDGTGLGALLTIKPGESKGTDQLGQNLELLGGQGTGSGLGGKIVFKVAPAGSTGTKNNNPVECMSVYGNKFVGLGPWGSNGTNIPLSLLHLLSNVAGTTPTITLENLSGTTNDENRIDSILNGAHAVSSRIGFLRTGSPAGSDTEMYFSTRGNNTMAKRMTIKSVGNVGINTDAPAATALLDLTSTTQGFLPPRMTTEQRDAITTPAEGLMIFNSTTKKLNFYNGTAWETVTSGVV